MSLIARRPKRATASPMRACPSRTAAKAKSAGSRHMAEPCLAAAALHTYPHLPWLKGRQLELLP
ncbi:MAG: hypothetical protein ISS72_06970 [Candidatus Brocadiae bacterium]|nr:hypothetical protein [Candidatus Brocadiia bacterium]